MNATRWTAVWLLVLTVCCVVISLPAKADGYAADYSPDAHMSMAAQIDHYWFRAAKAGNLNTINTLIEVKFDLNRSDSKGYTALILAAYHGHEQVVDRLLLAGANPCAKDKRGNTALMGAIFKAEVSIAKTLIAADCQVDQPNHNGQTAAMYAALFGRTALLKALEARGANLDQSDGMGNTARQISQGQLRTR